MRTSYVLAVAITMLAFTACGNPGTAPARPFDVGNGALPGGALRLPKPKSNEYAYVGFSQGATAGAHQAVVAVYTYPALQFVGSWIGTEYSAATDSLCSNAAGDVFAVLESQEIVEFAPGGLTPIATLSDPSGIPAGCSVDPTTGNLAVINNSYSNPFPGVLLIYRNASGTPVAETDPNLSFYALGYDNRGNLFLDGRRRAGAEFGLAELPAGGHSFTSIKLNETLRSAGIVQWDGTSMAIADDHRIKRFTVDGRRGTVVGSTRLRAHDPCGHIGGCRFGFWPDWIEGDIVLGAENLCLEGLPCGGEMALWRYPRGGRPFKEITSLPYVPFGMTVSAVRR